MWLLDASNIDGPTFKITEKIKELGILPTKYGNSAELSHAILSEPFLGDYLVLTFCQSNLGLPGSPDNRRSRSKSPKSCTNCSSSRSYGHFHRNSRDSHCVRNSRSNLNIGKENTLFKLSLAGQKLPIKRTYTNMFSLPWTHVTRRKTWRIAPRMPNLNMLGQT